MQYAVLSLPNKTDVESNKYYIDSAPANLKRKAEKYATQRGLKRGTDYEIYTPMSSKALDEDLNQIRRCSVVYIDAHGSTKRNSDGRSMPALDLPGSNSSDHARRDALPTELGLRDSAIKLLIAGVCYQEPSAWEDAVPPGCVVIGYNEMLYGIHFRHMYERFIDLQQMVKDPSLPKLPQLQESQDHIMEWFENCLATGTSRPSRSAWFITTGKG